jgi:hypothetical protein
VSDTATALDGSPSRASNPVSGPAVGVSDRATTPDGSPSKVSDPTSTLSHNTACLSDKVSGRRGLPAPAHPRVTGPPPAHHPQDHRTDGGTGGTSISIAPSPADAGSVPSFVAATKKEGTLNVICAA